MSKKTLKRGNKGYRKRKCLKGGNNTLKMWNTARKIANKIWKMSIKSPRNLASTFLLLY